MKAQCSVVLKLADQMLIIPALPSRSGSLVAFPCDRLCLATAPSQFSGPFHSLFTRAPTIFLAFVWVGSPKSFSPRPKANSYSPPLFTSHVICLKGHSLLVSFKVSEPDYDLVTVSDSPTPFLPRVVLDTPLIRAGLRPLDFRVCRLLAAIITKYQ